MVTEAERPADASSRWDAGGPRLGGMRALRRALLALGVASAIAAVLRVRGTGGVPPQQGGWRELSGPDLR